MIRKLLGLFVIALLIFVACMPAEEGPDNGTSEQGADLGLATATQLPLPTLRPTATTAPTSTLPPQEDRAPTPLPEPTEISAEPTLEPDATEDAIVPTLDPGAVERGIFMSPQLGAPGNIVMVTGYGFPAKAWLTLHWGPADGETGPFYWGVETDEAGQFEVGLIVPPAASWPDPPLEERDLLQLRVFSGALAPNEYYWANLTYAPTADPSALVLAYVNEDYDFKLMLPNQWTWSWIGNDTADVRFQAPDGDGNGFALVVDGTDETAIIPAIMAQEFPGETYTSGSMSVGVYPGTEVTTSTGKVVQFIPNNGRIVIVSFVLSTGDAAYNILGSFRLVE
nr:hypothetical protein [Anaerolineae bacterium]